MGIVVHLALGVIKISILLFYKRIFRTKQFTLIANSVLAFVVCFTIASVTVSSIPLSQIWKLWADIISRHMFSLLGQLIPGGRLENVT